jgi:hypothetical protein
MTTITRSYGFPGARQEIDVRCSAGLPGKTLAEGRCQLFAGHDGPHAVMYAGFGKRTVRTWSTRTAGGPRDIEVGGLQRPWMFGYPVPAWFETAAPELTD